MSYPFVSEKYKKPSLVSPEDLMSQTGKELICLPPRAVLCFPHGLAESFKNREDFQESFPFYKTGLNIDLYRKGKKGKERGVSLVSDFGMGAPAAVVCLEKLRALGIKECFSVGVVGSLNPDLKVGAKVLLKKSFRDEGCSDHYKALSPYVEIFESETCIKLVEKLKLKSVISWTTDAPFRETKEEVIYFQSKNVECVEMESAALMAAGEYYGISVFCMGVVSDHLSPKAWTPRFFDPAIKKSLYEILNQVLFL